jgi:hypothetical protein
MVSLLCNRINGKHEKANVLFRSMSEGIRRAKSKQLMAVTCSLILLPLSPNRRFVETRIQNFYELIYLYNT